MTFKAVLLLMILSNSLGKDLNRENSADKKHVVVIQPHKERHHKSGRKQTIERTRK